LYAVDAQALEDLQPDLIITQIFAMFARLRRMI